MFSTCSRTIKCRGNYRIGDTGMEVKEWSYCCYCKPMNILEVYLQHRFHSFIVSWLVLYVEDIADAHISLQLKNVGIITDPLSYLVSPMLVTYNFLYGPYEISQVWSLRSLALPHEGIDIYSAYLLLLTYITYCSE